MYRKISNNNTRIYEIYLRASFQNDRDIYFHSPRFQVAFHCNLSRSFVTVPLSIHITRHSIFDNIIIDRAQFLMDSKKNSPTNPLLISPLRNKVNEESNTKRTLAKSTSRIYRDRLKKRWDADRRCWRFKRSCPRLECPARETSGQ